MATATVTLTAIRAAVAGLLLSTALPVLAESSITFMRDENTSNKGESPTNHILENRIERRNYSLLLAARSVLGPQATQPQCADNLSPTQRQLIGQIAAVPDTVVNAKLAHEILLQQTSLQELQYCVLNATRTAKR